MIPDAEGGQIKRKSRAITSKIYVTPNDVYLPVSKLQSILAVAILLAHNNISQISLQSAAVNCNFSDNLTSLGVIFILLARVHYGLGSHDRTLQKGLASRLEPFTSSQSR